MPMPTVTAGPIVGTVPMHDDDPAASYSVSLTRWDRDGTATRIGVAMWEQANDAEQADAAALAAELRGALADAYHAGRADADAANAAAAPTDLDATSRRYIVTVHGVGNITHDPTNIHTILTSRDYIAPRDRVEVSAG